MVAQVLSMIPVVPPKSCLKCKRVSGDLVYARKDAYCKDCFLLFAKSKYRRAIDAFRLELPPGNRDVKMLLACSGGTSSSVLVDLAYTAVARTRGRYEMPIVLHVDETDFTDIPSEYTRGRLRMLKERYPELIFLEKSLSSPNQDDSQGTFAASQAGTNHAGPDEIYTTLKECIASLSSRTSQEDMLAMYKERLILKTAREHGCSAIVFGNSATSLAAKTLSLTAKGRGYALPWETADHSLSHSGIWSIRPMKGLMSAEIQVYADLIGLESASRSGLTGTGPPLSIDELTHRYFDGLETQFPSLVATVVRTTNKLIEPTSRDQAFGNCTICGMSYQEDARRWLADITVSQAAPDHSNNGPGLYEDEGPKPDLCYGCVVALRGSKSNITWPMLDAAADVQTRANGIEEVLGKFELDEDPA